MVLSGSSWRESSSLSSTAGDTEAELGPVRPQSLRAPLTQQDCGKRSASGLGSELTGSEVIVGPVRSIRGSRLCLDHQPYLPTIMSSLSEALGLALW
ncbi:hypothetical protein EYF80_021452 [Liparis tanakae]|uniref:Uncharacterized protein n=1 Tax=Liparis tanakae TaxID=230148 RepID=A0A4Z2HRU5_9TELE|nr:hypothetical protein EYF80_021452 [Liparis tanakae]